MVLISLVVKSCWISANEPGKISILFSLRGDFTDLSSQSGLTPVSDDILGQSCFSLECLTHGHHICLKVDGTVLSIQPS